jgi:hypothetical protein
MHIGATLVFSLLDYFAREDTSATSPLAQY